MPEPFAVYLNARSLVILLAEHFRLTLTRHGR